MDRYIGIDAHSASCTIAVIGPTGRRISSQVIETNGKSLVGAVGAIPGTRLDYGESSGIPPWKWFLSGQKHPMIGDEEMGNTQELF